MKVTLTSSPIALRAGQSFLGVLQEECGAHGWLVEAGTERSDTWIRVRHPYAVTPAQGWKVHVSATVASAREVLGTVLPILMNDDAPFKVAASLGALASLNEGNGGESQIGKFITIYPGDDGQAVRLAVALDAATRGLAGPAIPSDRPIRPGSIVSYRYGGFATPLMQTALGEVLPSLRTADGRLVPDRRNTWYVAPEGVTDPFEAAGVVQPPPPPSLVVGDRYALISLVQRSPRGTVYLAVDTRSAQRVVVKRARRDALTSDRGRDARDRLRAEARVLAVLAPHPGLPEVYDMVEHEDDLYLVMEDIDGATIEEHVIGMSRWGQCVPPAQVIAWGRELARTLAHVHERGFVYRDLKSPNVIVAADGRLRLIDFDMAQPVGDTEPPFGKGTRGYVSPQQHAGALPAVTDDVYGLGALLYFLATSAEPSRAPAEFDLCARAIGLINPAIEPGLAGVIARCLDPDPAGRYPSMAALEDALAGAAHGSAATPSVASVPERAACERARDLARRLADTLCAEARPAPFGPGLAWVTRHPLGVGGIYMRDINIGSAGTLLALAELAATFSESRWWDTVAEGASWLAVAPPFAGEPLAGLYVGEAGVGAALLRAGQVLGNVEFIAAAAEKGRLIARLPHTSPDLFNGTAGRLRFHLWLWDQTGDEEHLRAARAAGTVLLQTAERTAAGGTHWVLPDGYGSMSGTAPLGYAHGTAGIADALLDLVEATGDTAVREAAAGAARWLSSQAVPSLDDGRGLSWPTTEGDEPFLSWWCHGATGIGRFFLRAAALELIPEAETLAMGAARAVAHGTGSLAPSQCHGLAGSIEFLIDVYQATGDRAWLCNARRLARLLEAQGVEQDGKLVFAGEAPGVFTPDYMVGYAGVAVCLLRLAAPERRPHQLSLAGFRYRA